MRKFLARYRLGDGRHGTLHLLATDSCDATARAIDSLGQLCCALSVRPLVSGGAR
jgi:hypothetical protein